jgi:hypothetical protein
MAALWVHHGPRFADSLRVDYFRRLRCFVSRLGVVAAIRTWQLGSRAHGHVCPAWYLRARFWLESRKSKSCVVVMIEIVFWN